MRNIFIALIIATALILFFSFTNNRPVLVNEDDYTEDEPAPLDTFLLKKDAAKRKAGTTTYDAFGKPEKIDTTQLK